MTTDTTTLTTWLLEQIAADEMECQELADRYPGDADRFFWYGNADDIDIRVGIGTGLATCAAHRAIVSEFEAIVSAAVIPIGEERDAVAAVEQIYSGRALAVAVRHLASIYADRPGFDARWAL